MTNTIEPQLERFLRKHSGSSEPLIAVFDCDGTLIGGDVGESMFYYQLEHFLLRVSPATLWPDHPKGEELSNLYESLSDLPPEKAVHDRRFVALADLMLNWYFDQLAQGKTEKACADIVKLFAGFSPADVQDIARFTLKKEQAASPGMWTLGTFQLSRGIKYIKETVEILTLLRKRGFDVWVVSGSNRWSVEAVCESLGVPGRHVIGIELHEDNGVLTDTVTVPIPVLEGKVAALQEHVSARPLLVASDSTYDIPLFNYSSGLRVLVQSTDDRDFFAAGKVPRDDRWLVIESPTYLDENLWPTQQ